MDLKVSLYSRSERASERAKEKESSKKDLIGRILSSVGFVIERYGSIHSLGLLACR